MFVLDPNPTFTHTITARVPVDGGFEDQPFKVTYRVMDDDQLTAIDMREARSAIGFLRDVIVGLDEIEGPDKQPLPYSDRLRDQLIGLPFVRQPMVRGYFDAVYQARLGN